MYLRQFQLAVAAAAEKSAGRAAVFAAARAGTYPAHIHGYISSFDDALTANCSGTSSCLPGILLYS